MDEVTEGWAGYAPLTPLRRLWRKKPVVIEAVRLDGWGSWPEVADFLPIVEDGWTGIVGGMRTPGGEYHWGELARPYDGCSIAVRIPTLEGVMIAEDGDWIIKGVSGEFYPCKPDIFEKTYEKVEAEDVRA